MDYNEKARLKWVKFYEKGKSISYISRHCGISRPTLYKWIKRYKQFGSNGLSDLSKKPKNSPRLKRTPELEQLIIDLRKKRNLGARRIQNELIRLHDQQLSLATIHKVLSNHKVKPIVKIKREKKFTRYQKEIPAERVQMDTCKIAPGIYQYTAVDDCTRMRVLRVFKRRTGANTKLFLEACIEEFPFPIQRIQTDRGTEFFAEKVQKLMMEYCIKFRPTKPASPHLNGKVERSQKTDLQEFYSTVDLKDKNLGDMLVDWQHEYNWNRPHGSLNGKTPMDKYHDLINKTPLSEEIESEYFIQNEYIQLSNYKNDLKLRNCKGSV